MKVVSMIGLDNDKPPSCKDIIRHSIATGIRPVSGDGSNARRRRMDFICHLPNPMLSSRFRNDLVILDTL